MPKITSDMSLLELGQILQRLREAAGMSRSELAGKIGTRYDIIRLYEEGQRVMRVDRLLEILDALGIHLTELLHLKTAGNTGGKPEAYQMAEKLSALDATSYQRLMRKIQSMVAEEEAG